MSAAFARDVSARCARIAEAFADGETVLALSVLADLEHDARQIAHEIEPIESSVRSAGTRVLRTIDHCLGCGAEIVYEPGAEVSWCEDCRQERAA
jgi:predicted Zn-ribbon and HTH transcriptional regulator